MTSPFKPVGKHENVSFCALTERNHPILSGSWPFTPSVMIMIWVQLTIGGRGVKGGGQRRSIGVTIRFLPISRDRLQVETRYWCQATWPIELLRRMRTLIYLGHDLTLTWHDMRSNFEIDHSRWKSACSEQARQGWHDGVLFVSPIQKVVNEKPSRWKRIFFIWWPLQPKLLDLRSNLIIKSYWGMKGAPHSFFKFFLAIILLEMQRLFAKNRYFLKIWHLVTSVDLNIDLTWKWPWQSLGSRCGLSYAVYHLSLISVVFKVRWGSLKPHTTTNWSF